MPESQHFQQVQTPGANIASPYFFFSNFSLFLELGMNQSAADASEEHSTLLREHLAGFVNE